MNPGRCKKCNGDIIWVPNPRGGWLRPMERFDAHLDAETYNLLHGREVYLAQDGAIALVRGSSLLVWHECQPGMQEEAMVGAGDKILMGTGEVITDEQLEEIVQARVDAALARQGEHQEAEQIVRDRQAAREVEAREHVERHKVQRTHRARERARSKQGKALLVMCPNCEAEIGDLCRRKVTSTWDEPFIENAHRERWDWLYGSGTAEENLFTPPVSPSIQYRRVRTRVTPLRRVQARALVDWLARNGSILWSEIRTIDPGDGAEGADGPTVYPEAFGN